jgi:serine/threonine protein kinase
MKIQEDQMQILLNEMNIMRTCADPCVVEFIGAYKKSSEKLWIIIELMDGGAVNKILEYHDDIPMSERQVARVVVDVC